MKTQLTFIRIIAASFIMMSASFASPARPVLELLELLTKQSGRVSPEAVTAVERAFARHGDDAIKAFRHGGGGLAEAAARHGDELMGAALRVPDAAPMLARRADELLPLVRAHGDDILRLEAKAPGLATEAARLYPEGADITRLAQMAPDQASRTLSFAARANDPATRKQLLLAVEKHGPSLLERLPATQIMAYGLSAAMITTAITVSAQAPDAIAEIGHEIASKVGTAVAIVIGSAGVLAVLYFTLPFILQSRARRAVRARVPSGRDRDRSH